MQPFQSVCVSLWATLKIPLSCPIAVSKRQCSTDVTDVTLVVVSVHFGRDRTLVVSVQHGRDRTLVVSV